MGLGFDFSSTSSATSSQLRVTRSETSNVEEDSLVSFYIGLTESDSGLIALANIDITGISAVLYKSTGGGAFASVGITQPVFAKANGLVSVDYQFLAAEWAVGDGYKLVVTGISCTVNGDTVYVEPAIWSGSVIDETVLHGKVDIIDNICDANSFVPGTGTVYYVTTVGNDGNSGLSWETSLLTIDAAVNKCSANVGDVILIAPGTYDENANVAGIIVDIAGITIRGLTDTNGNRVLIRNSTGGIGACISVSESKVVIENLSVEENIMYGLWCSGDYCTFRNLYVGINFSEGIILEGANHCIIEDCIVVGGANQTIQLKSTSDYNIIRNCTLVVDGGADVLELNASDYNLISGCIIHGKGLAANGIYITSALYNIITADTIITNCTDGIDIDGTSNKNVLGAAIINCTNSINDSSGNSNLADGSISNLYDSITKSVNEPPTAKSLHDILHKDGSYTYDNTTDSLEAIADAITALNDISTSDVNTEVDNALNTIVPASPTAGSLNDILSKAAGANTFDKSTDSLEALRDRIDTLNTADQADLDAILLDTGTTLPATLTGIEGKIDTIDLVVDGIQTDLSNATDGLGALKSLIDTVDSVVDDIKIVTDALPDAGALTSIAQNSDVDIIDSNVDNLISLSLIDYDNFDVADADADTERWNIGYINGTEGGSADINTTTAGKLRISLTPDATPTAASYATNLAKLVTTEKFVATVDCDVSSFGTPAGSWASMGIRISLGTYDTDNTVYLERQSSSDGVGNRFACGAVFGSAAQSEAYFTSNDTAFALKIERIGNIFRCYYSLTQSPNEVWVLLSQYEDSASAIGRETRIYLQSYSPGNAETQTAVADFDNFKLYSLQSDIYNLLDVVKNKDTGYTFDQSTDSLESISEAVATIDTVVDSIEDYVDGTTATPTAYRREIGKTQFFSKNITSAANAGSVTVATITTQPCMIKSLVLRSNGATTGDLTSAAIEGGASSVVEFISAASAVQANIDAADKQVSWTGAVSLNAAGTITVDLQGTGATAVDLDVDIEYFTCADGGYLV